MCPRYAIINFLVWYRACFIIMFWPSKLSRFFNYLPRNNTKFWFNYITWIYLVMFVRLIFPRGARNILKRYSREPVRAKKLKKTTNFLKATHNWFSGPFFCWYQTFRPDRIKKPLFLFYFLLPIDSEHIFGTTGSTEMVHLATSAVFLMVNWLDCSCTDVGKYS